MPSLMMYKRRQQIKAFRFSACGCGTRVYSSSVEQVYTQILEDLRKGQYYMQLEKQPLAYRYRFSAMAAKALEARIRLYRSEWELALQAAQELLPGCELEDLNDPDAAFSLLL